MKSVETDYLIVGNSAAAIGAVEGIRSRDREGRIVLLSREERHTYSRPLISYLLAGEVEEEGMYYRPAGFYEEQGVEALLGTEATSLDPGRRLLEVADGRRFAFRALLLATGGRPLVPEIRGAAGTAGVFTFTSWDDVEGLARYLEEASPRRAVVLGGGLIGIKAAEALVARGLGVLVVELAGRLLPLALDERASRLAEEALRRAGAELACGLTVESVLSRGGALAGVVLSDGRREECGLLVLAIGVRPEKALAEAAGISCGRGILVDEGMRTSAPGVYAAGDAAEAVDVLTGERRPIPILPNAYRQGWIAGVNMAGGELRAEGFMAMNSVEVFGLPTVSVGLATAEGPEYEVLTAGDEGAGTYRRVVLRKNRVVGALFVGEIDRAGIYTGLIRHRIDVSGFKELLLTDQFGLLCLPQEYRKHVVRGEGIEV